MLLETTLALAALSAPAAQDPLEDPNPPSPPRADDVAPQDDMVGADARLAARLRAKGDGERAILEARIAAFLSKQDEARAAKALAIEETKLAKALIEKLKAAGTKPAESLADIKAAKLLIEEFEAAGTKADSAIKAAKVHIGLPLAAAERLHEIEKALLRQAEVETGDLDAVDLLEVKDAYLRVLEKRVTGAAGGGAETSNESSPLVSITVHEGDVHVHLGGEDRTPARLGAGQSPPPKVADHGEDEGLRARFDLSVDSIEVLGFRSSDESPEGSQLEISSEGYLSLLGPGSPADAAPDGETFTFLNFGSHAPVVSGGLTAGLPIISGVMSEGELIEGQPGPLFHLALTDPSLEPDGSQGRSTEGGLRLEAAGEEELLGELLRMMNELQSDLDALHREVRSLEAEIAPAPRRRRGSR